LKSDDISDWPIPNKIPDCATEHVYVLTTNKKTKTNKKADMG